MSFAVPNAFWLAACAAPIVVFYILKVRLRRQPVSTNLFWRQIFDEKPPRSIWQYLRHLLSLFAQLLLLAMLVAAVADPYLPWQLLEARRIVAVVDRSASMRAADVVPSRFDAAIDAALKLVDGLRFRDELAVVTAGSRPEVVIGMSSHAPTLKRALRAISVTDEPSDLAAAIDLGRQLIGNHPRGQLLVYSDGCAEISNQAVDPPADHRKSSQTSDATQSAAAIALNQNGPAVRNFTFATRAANLGITQMQVRRSLVDPLGYEVLVAVVNAADHDAQCRLELALSGAAVDVLPLRLKANEKWQRTLQKTSIEGGTLTATLTHVVVPDATRTNTNDAIGEVTGKPGPAINVLSVDDTARAILPPRKVQRVLLVTEGNLFLQKVLEANPLVECEVRKEMPTTWPVETIIVLHRHIPQVLPDGNVFVIDPIERCNDWDLGQMLANPIVTQQQSDSPLMTHVRLDNVLMPEARQIAFKAAPLVLAGTLSGDPVYAALKREGGKCLVLSVDLDRSDLAFRTAFPIMVTNALGWFRGDAGEFQSSLKTGQIAIIALPEARLGPSAQLILRSPGARAFDIPAPSAQGQVNRPSEATASSGAAAESIANSSAAADVALGPLDECGVWTLVSRDSSSTEKLAAELAVNLANERESDLRPRDELLADSAALPLATTWFARPLWFYLAGCAFALTVVEWLLYQRRIIT